MAKINSSSFGSVTVDGVRYEHDIYILPSGKIERRERSHTITDEEVKRILKEKPEAVVIGKGTAGVASISQDAMETLKKAGVELVEGNTPDIKNKFNELAGRKRVCAIIHTTC